MSTEIIWQPQSGPQEAAILCEEDDLLFGGARGGGKGLILNDNLLTDSGWKSVKDIRITDKLVAPDGTYTNIIGIFPQGEKDTYKITFDDDASIECDGDHKWSTWSGAHGWRDGWVVRTTNELRNYKGTISIPLIQTPAPGNEWKGPDPYILGYILGNGTLTSEQTTIYTIEPDLIQDLKRQGWKAYCYKPPVFMCQLKDEEYRDVLGRNIGDQKRIPEELLHSDPKTRLALLQGLMDSDGSIDNEGRCTFATVSRFLAEGVEYLARSLGGKSKINVKRKVSSRGGRGWYYNVRVTHIGKFNPFRIDRKASRVNPNQNGRSRRIISIVPTGRSETICFAVDHPSHQFVCQDFIVTHNTDYIIGDWLVHNEKYGGSTAGVIIRRTYPQLQEILKRSHEIYPKVGAVYKVAEKRWVFPNGGVLYLRHFEGNDAFEDMQGWNLTRLYVDEMGQFPSSEPLDKLKASLRNKEGVPVGFRATANPGGAGHHWIKSRYIDAAPAGYTLLKSGKGQYRVFIPSKVTDNKILLDNDPNYVERLKGIGSPELIRAWLDGDWSVIQGAYFPEFSYDKHVVRPEVLPKEWLRFKAMDWGSSAPFAVLWFAVSDGNYGIYPKNSLIVYREWYGGKDGKGWKLPISEVARGIKSMELRGETRYSVIDPAAFKEEGGPSIAEGLAKYGVNFRRADNARVAGWTEIRNRLVGIDDKPTLYIFDTCPNLIRTLPSMQHDDRRPEDIDCWTAGTMVSTSFGDKKIEDIIPGDIVETPIGNRHVIKSYLSGTSETIIVELSNGKFLEGTPHHKIYVKEKGLVALSDLNCYDILIERNNLWQKRLLCMMVLFTLVMTGVSIIIQTALIWLKKLKQVCIDKFGLMQVEQSQKDGIFIISTEMSIITHWKTLTAFLVRSIYGSTSKKNKWRCNKNWIYGVGRMKGSRPCVITQEKCTKIPLDALARARIVAILLKLDILQRTLVQVVAKKQWVLNKLKKHAKYVVKLFGLERLLTEKHKPVHIVAVGRSEKRKPVYNITVLDAQLFYANGFLSSNTNGDDHCVDTLRYGCMSRPWISKPSSNDEKSKIKFMQDMTFSDLFPLKRKNNHPSDKRI